MDMYKNKMTMTMDTKLEMTSDMTYEMTSDMTPDMTSDIKLIQVCEAEISSETCIKWPNQTKLSIFGTSRRISQPHELGLIYRLLR